MGSEGFLDWVQDIYTKEPKNTDVLITIYSADGGGVLLKVRGGQCIDMGTSSTHTCSMMAIPSQGARRKGALVDILAMRMECLVTFTYKISAMCWN